MTETKTDDHDLYARQGIGSQIGFGEHPAVIVVDYQLAFTRGALAGDYPEAALRSTARICDAARALGAPVIYSVLCLRGGSLRRRPVRRQVPRAWWPACAAREGCDDRPARAPEPGDVVLREAAALGVLRHRRCTSA